MSRFPIHSESSSPEGSVESLRLAKEKYGFVPNLLGILAAAPSAVDAYLSLGTLFERTSLTPVEQQLVLASASVTNGCEYCVAAHSAGLRMTGLDDEALSRVRAGRRLDDPKLEALRSFTTALVETRGRPSEDDLQAFRAVGYRPEQVLEVLVGLALKTLSNYANHIVHTPLDPQLAPHAWDAGALVSEDSAA